MRYGSTENLTKALVGKIKITTLDLKLRTLHSRLRLKAGFDPSQARVPSGNPDGGQWSGGNGGGGASTRTRRTRVAGSGRGGGRASPQPRPAQVMRHAVARARARAATARVREVDPNWRPKPSLTSPGSIEGNIRAERSIARQAEARLAEIARSQNRDSNRPGIGHNQGPPLDPTSIGGRSDPIARISTSREPAAWLRAYRRAHDMPARGALGRRDKDERTVAYGEISGEPVFGVSSTAPGYTRTDSSAAKALRDRMLKREEYQEVLITTGNIGRKPNDAFFHAEATTILRGATINGGSLAGQRIEIHVDRPMCWSCDAVLPHITKELGNPTVTFVDSNGMRATIRNGKWED